jgi:hypothetical protein
MMNRLPAPVAGTRKKPEAVLEKMCRVLFVIYRALIMFNRALFGLYGVLKIV